MAWKLEKKTVFACVVFFSRFSATTGIHPFDFNAKICLDSFMALHCIFGHVLYTTVAAKILAKTRGIKKQGRPIVSYRIINSLNIMSYFPTL